MKKVLFLLLAAGLLSCAPESGNEAEFRLHVNAGEYDRDNTLVTFELPGAIDPEKTYRVTDPQNRSMPVQIDGKKASFILPELKAGEELSLRLAPTRKRNPDGIEIEFFRDAVAFSFDEDRPVLQYRAGPGGLDLSHVDEIFHRSGYLHPVYSPAGHVVTQQYTSGRPHQKGIWTAWYRTDFRGSSPDFWSPRSGTGKVELYSVDRIWSGPVHSGLRTRHHFVANTADDPFPIVEDHWTVQIYNTPTKNNRPVYLFDLDVSQLNITGDTITLLENVYGGVGFRGNDSWLGGDNTRLLTSEGKNRVEGHESRARWVQLTGIADDDRPGIAILVHPDNPRFPEPVFINQSEPFFNFSPLQLGDIVIDPGETYRVRYRYAVMDGEPDPGFLESLWQDYANPVTVTVE